MTDNNQGRFQQVAYPLFVLLLLVLIAAAIYGHTLNAPFMYDGAINIVQNPYIRMDVFSWEKLTQIMKSPSPRPLANLTFAANYFFHQYDVTGYHLINILIHIINAFLVFLITRQTLRRCQINLPLVPAIAATLWLVHPVHTQSVTYIVQRMNALSAMFYLLALTCYIAARNATRLSSTHKRKKGALLLAVCMISGLFALASKPIAATLPITIFLYEWYFFQNRSYIWLKKHTRWISVVVILCVIVACVFLGQNPIERILNGYQFRHFNIMERVLTEPRIVLYYLSLFFFPHPSRLTLLYDFPVVKSWASPATMLTFFALSALVGMALALARKHPISSFALLWFIVNLAIESSVIGLQLAFEHRVYLPVVFPVIALTLLAFQYLKRPLSIGLLSVIIVFSAIWTHQRNTTWLTMPGFWADNAAKAPRRPDPHSNLGLSLLNDGQPEEAITSCRNALRLLGLAPLSSFDAILADYTPARFVYQSKPESVLSTWGKALQQIGETEKAADLYRKAIYINPEAFLPRFRLAGILMEQDKIDAAISHLKVSVRTAPNPSGALVLLAQAMEQNNDSQEAIRLYQKAIRLDPMLISAYNQLGKLYLKSGDIQTAHQYLQRAVDIEPTNGITLSDLAGALLADKPTARQTDKALQILKKSVKQAPDYAKAFNNLGVAYYYKGQIENALYCFEKAIQLDASYLEAKTNLQQILQSGAAHSVRPTISGLKTQLAIDPHNPELLYALGRLHEKQGNDQGAITFYQNVLQRQPNALDCMERLAGLYARHNQLARATELYITMADILPDTPTLYYNLACLYARQHKQEKAVTCLKTAVEKGYDRWDHLLADPDLDLIKKTNYYKLLKKRHGTSQINQGVNTP